MPLIKDLQDVGRGVAVGCLFVCGAGTVAIYKLQQYWDTSELVAMGLGVVVVSACGRYAVVQTKKQINAAPSMGALLALLKQKFLAAPQSAEESETFDWVEAFTKRYHGRRYLHGLPVGVDENGHFVEVPMERQDSHLFLSSMTGSGKSILANQIILGASLTGLYQVCLVGRTMKDYALLMGMNNVHSVTFHPDDGFDYEVDLPLVLDSAYREIMRRQRFLEEKGKRQMSDVRPDQRMQSIFLVVDEFTNAAESIKLSKGNRFMGALFSSAIRIAQEGRAVGVHMMLIGQRPTGMVPKSLRAQMVNITYKTANAQESYWATGAKDSGAEDLAVGDAKAGSMSEVAIVGGYVNFKAFVPITFDNALKRAAAKDESRSGEEPLWLHGFRPSNRTAVVPEIQPVTAVRAAYPAGTTGESPEVEAEILPKPAGTGTAGTTLSGVINGVGEWAIELFDTHEDFIDAPKSLDPRKVAEIALCKVIGLSGNATMRAVFNGNRKQEYRDWVNLIWVHMEQANVTAS